MRQDSPDSLYALRSLTAHLSRAAQPGTEFRPFLTDFVRALSQHWPVLAHVNIYVQQPDRTYARLAGIDLPPDAEPLLASEALVTQVSASHTPVLPDTDASPARWLIPLVSADTMIGFVEADLQPGQPVPPVLEPLLLALAGPLTLAIDRLRVEPLFGEHLAGDKSSSLLAALSTMTRQISISHVDADVLHTLCRNLTEMLGLDYMAILRFDAPSSSATVTAEHPVRLGQTEQLALEDFGIYQRLQTYQTPIVIDNLEASVELLGQHHSRFQALNLHALLVAPLLVQGDLMGALLLATVDRARAISPDELHVAQTVATQIALSLRTAEFFTEIQRRANQLERIAAFGRLVTGTLEEAQILRHVIEVVPNLLPADQVGVAFYTLDQNRMRLVELGGGIIPQETSVTAAGSSVEEVVQHHTPLLIADLSSSTYTDHPRLVQQGLQSAIVAPLTVSGRMLGAVTVAHQRVRMYTPTDLTLLQQIGNQIAIALENANIFNTAQRRATYEETLSEITSHLQEQSDLRMILQQTMRDFGEVLGASHARVRLQVTPSEFDISKLFQPKE